MVLEASRAKDFTAINDFSVDRPRTRVVGLAGPAHAESAEAASARKVPSRKRVKRKVRAAHDQFRRTDSTDLGDDLALGRLTDGANVCWAAHACEVLSQEGPGLLECLSYSNTAR